MIYCPLKSSTAVYKARGMYGIVEPFTRFDNYSICASQGLYYRLAAQDTNQSKKLEKLILFQNPTSDKLTVFLQSEIKEDYSIEIFNLLDQIIYKNENLANEITLKLDELQLSSGNYFITMTQNSTGQAFRSRFIYKK